MAFAREELHHLVVRAESLRERRRASEGRPAPTPSAEATLGAHRFLESWSAVVADGDHDRFTRRLAWDAGTPLQALQLYLRADGVSHEPLPSWARLVDLASHEAQRCVERDDWPDRSRCATTPCAFEDIVVPFVRVARAQVIYGDLAEAAQARLEHALLRKLTRACAPTLYFKWDVRRSMHPLAFLGLSGSDRPADRRYREFVSEICLDGFHRLFGEYPALARVLGTLCLQWQQRVQDLTRRIADDLPVLREVFGDLIGSGVVTDITADLSDPHRGGQTVCFVDFEGGGRVVYKPRSLSIERGYSQLLAWLGARVAPSLRALRVIDRGAYGWEEFVQGGADVSREAAERFYERAGMHACLAYVLGGADLHAGNLIAADDEPILIDLELLACAPFKPAGGMPNPVLQHGNADTWHSVLRTLLIPVRGPGAGQGAYGLGVQEATGGVPQDRYVFPNTDHMIRRTVPVPRGATGNLPRGNGRVHTPLQHQAALVRGFRAMYTALIVHRGALTADDSPLAAFRNHKVRLLLRNTGAYDSVLDQALHPTALRSGLDRSMCFERLLAPFTRSATPPHLWPLWCAEQDQLEQLDVPCFHHTASELDAHADNGVTVPAVLAHTGYDAIVARLSNLDAADMQAQLHCLRLAFLPPAAVTVDVPDAPDAERPLDTDQCIAAAASIAGGLYRTAIEAEDGGVTWAALANMGGTTAQLPLQIVGPALFGGASGPALFLSALARVTGEPRHHELAARALAPILGDLDRRGARAMVRELGLGAGRGAPGVAYALSHCAAFLRRDDLAQGASALCHELSPELIAADKDFDLMFGAAGTIVGVLATWRLTRERELLDIALACARHLLSRRTRDARSGHRAWRTLDGQMTSGFSHGSAGIAYALMTLARESHDPALADAASEAVAFERTLFDPVCANWHEAAPAVMGTPADKAWSSWCHGATGIGLGRLATLDVVGGAAERGDIEAALGTTLKQGTHPVDYACCGTFGRVEFLLEGSRGLHRGDLANAAGALAGRVVSRARRAGTYSTGLDDAYSPGFFQGTAGIGYGLLRFVDPSLPSVLLWQ